MKRLNIKVLLLCLATFIMATAVAWGVFEAVPHLEDEQANLFQAKVFAIGQVTVAAPPVPGSFFIPFVVNFNGRLFGKYTPGYPLALALGALIGQPWLVNALAAALGGPAAGPRGVDRPGRGGGVARPPFRGAPR